MIASSAQAWQVGASIVQSSIHDTGQIRHVDNLYSLYQSVCRRWLCHWIIAKEAAFEHAACAECFEMAVDAAN